MEERELKCNQSILNSDSPISNVFRNTWIQLSRLEITYIHIYIEREGTQFLQESWYHLIFTLCIMILVHHLLCWTSALTMDLCWENRRPWKQKDIFYFQLSGQEENGE